MIPIESVEKIVRECIARHAGISPLQVRRSSRLARLGISGEKKVETIADFERWFGIVLVPYSATICTAGELTDVIIGSVNNLRGASGICR
jgi:hypothetical protein